MINNVSSEAAQRNLSFLSFVHYDNTWSRIMHKVPLQFYGKHCSLQYFGDMIQKARKLYDQMSLQSKEYKQYVYILDII